MAVMPKSTGTATKTKKPNVSVQTNGSMGKTGLTSSSPSSATKRLPGSAQPQSTAVGNGVSANGGPRSNRRLQRLSTRVSTSDNLIMERKAALPAEPHVVTEKHILAKFKNKPPSLIIHLYSNYFRFDQQEGSFAYHSEMRVFMEHLKKRTIPHDMLEELRKDNVKFYDGWLTVKIVDHKSVAADPAGAHGAGDDDKPFSIHNYNHFITPSPCVPFPTPEQLAQSPPVKQEREDSVTDKENHAPDGTTGMVGGPVRSVQPQLKVFWTALRPTDLSRQVDLMLDCTAPDPKAKKLQNKPGQPPTPVGTVPPTPIAERPPPLKKQKLRIDPKDHLEYEARIINAIAPPLYLEPAKDLDDMERIYNMLADPFCQEAPPSPKSRKRTFAELAAEDAHAKEQERFMLIMDARGSGTANTNAGVIEAQTGNVTFQPRFERFNALDNIKREFNEKKQRDAEKRLQEDELRRSQQQQQQEEEKKRQTQQALIAQRKEQAILRQQQQQQQQQQQVQMQQQRQSQDNMTAQQPQNIANTQQRRATGGQPQPNGIPPQMQNQMMVQASSPIIRQGTPHAASSPATANGRPMARNNSQAGGAASPPRPGSSLQHSHPSAGGQGGPSRNGTPQIPHSTPGMPNATPIMRQGTPAHAMTQASPAASIAMATPQMSQVNMQVQMPNGVHPAQQQQQQAQLAAMQRRQMQQQAQLQSQMNGGQPINPAMMAQHIAQQQAQQARQASLQRQQAEQAAMQGTPQPQHMSPAPQTQQNYNAQLRKQMMQQMGQQGSPAPGQMSPQQMQQMQMQQAQQQAAQQAMQNQQGQHPQQGQPQQRQANPQMQQMVNSMTMQYFKQLMMQESQKYQGNPNMIPGPIKAQLQITAQKQAILAFQKRQQQMVQNQQMMAQQNNPMMTPQMQMANVNVNNNMAAMQQQQQHQQNQQAQARQMQQMQIQNAQQQMVQANYQAQMVQMMQNHSRGQQGQQGQR